jgi:hypothetical protein
METLYRNAWASENCIAIAAQITAIIMAVLAAVVVILLVILYWASRRRGTPLPPMGWPMAGLAVVILAIVGYAILDGRTTNRILVTTDGLEFVGCDGLSAFRERVAFSDIAGVAYRTRRTGGRSPQLLDEVALTPRDSDAAWVIPLSNDAGMLDPVLLRRVVPAPVIEAWRDAVTARGGRLPAGF